MKVNKCELLKKSNAIAIVGISRNPNRISREIANYLVFNGFNVVGVNPNESFNNAGGIIVYNSLLDIPHHIDIVNVFRIYLLSDEPLEKEDSIMLRQFFGELVDISSVTNYITQEFIQKDLYEHVDDSWNVKTYQKMLDIVGSKYKIQSIDEKDWLNLSQE